MSTRKVFFAACPLGLSEVLSDELRSFGAEDIEPQPGGVGFEGPLEVAYRACLLSRVANRVLLRLARFPLASTDDIYAGALSVDWNEQLRRDASFIVGVSGRHHSVRHSRFAAQRVKDAIVDQCRDLEGWRPRVDLERPDLRLQLRLGASVGMLGIDLSGASMHRRGYRGPHAPAPLKENLAAGILLLAGWPGLASQGVPFCDPMCGSGTLVIEAALMAAKRPPRTPKERLGSEAWRGHDEKAWTHVRKEVQAMDWEKTVPPILGYDQSVEAVRAAKKGAALAGVEDLVRFAVRPLAAQSAASLGIEEEPAPGSEDTSLRPEGLPSGLLVTNPPYGERLGEEAELPALYGSLGDVLKRGFPGWRAAVLAGNRKLEKRIGLKPDAWIDLMNGAIPCRLVSYAISSWTPSSEEGPRWRQRARALEIPGQGAGAEAFANRLRKNARHRDKWARRAGLEAYRVYDADLPEYKVAIDRYGSALHVAEYAPPKDIDEFAASARLADVKALAPELLGVKPQDLFMKVRSRQRGADQYTRQTPQEFSFTNEPGAQVVRVIREGAFSFEVNLADYLDTGLFLDHRDLRLRLKSEAKGARFLNLFAYTGSATVYAAAGGATKTCSVDMSRTYLDWAARNMELNDVSGAAHELVQADCLVWIKEAALREDERYDLILLAPPTFSNSKRMAQVFDVQEDHPSLIRDAAALLAPGGRLFFSVNHRRFSLNTEVLLAETPGLQIKEISRETLPKDFERNPRIHKTWAISK
jgi:23S rRNA (guanine2069-N7)-methyltransferase / 23S rRNA (guanine2445-N2)-methyltransferase